MARSDAKPLLTLFLLSKNCIESVMRTGYVLKPRYIPIALHCGYSVLGCVTNCIPCLKDEYEFLNLSAWFWALRIQTFPLPKSTLVFCHLLPKLFTVNQHYLKDGSVCHVEICRDRT